MLRFRSTSFGLTLLLFGTVALSTGCAGDEDDDTTMMDASVQDTGSDAGTVDTGRPDTGTPADTGVDGGMMDAGDDTCLPNETVDVDGTAVTVDEATTLPVTSAGANAVLTCRRAPEPEFSNDYCLVECLDFLGAAPSQAELDQLEFAVFPLEDISGTPTGVDPTYSATTGIDNDPNLRLDLGYRVVSQSADCDSGYHVELGFTAGIGAGSESFASEIRYVVRVRAVQTSTPAWVDTYHYRFVRRNDQVPQVGQCGVDEQRVPGRVFEFPVVHKSVIEEVVAGAGAAVPGSDNLFDGLGTGYAVLEARDCSGSGGSRMTNATAGTTPTPITDVYPGDDYALDRTALFTSESGLFVAGGYAEMTATSSASMDVAAAVGVTSDGTCTEAHGGTTFPVWPDAVTYVRFSRETTLIE